MSRRGERFNRCLLVEKVARRSRDGCVVNVSRDEISNDRALHGASLRTQPHPPFGHLEVNCRRQERPPWGVSLGRRRQYRKVLCVKHIHNPQLVALAQTLRKNMTKEERHLWYDFLKSLPTMVHRQKIFGRYIVDFYIAEHNLVIELDGSQHYEEDGKRSDHVRDEYLQSLGLTVLRYSNLDVMRDFRGVCTDILHHMKAEA